MRNMLRQSPQIEADGNTGQRTIRFNVISRAKARKIQCLGPFLVAPRRNGHMTTRKTTAADHLDAMTTVAICVEHQLTKCVWQQNFSGIASEYKVCEDLQVAVVSPE
ncbi:hypothetical protein J3459_014986 [Metarhizium acridum]|uniref:uncharacterized protein n=1 Tax=Metarhizium acridum TaxID=92637 RepID=UPI001C6D1434|nr:hypothetical protein J3459_014986 [Metarhizium acridum]KAG8419478.1 hypothetical protein J3458_004340 [Metarhizium acridum]